MNKDTYISKPCVICKTETILACSDCAIDGRGSIHICAKKECRDSHENEFHQGRDKP
jgi:hypothetical protein